MVKIRLARFGAKNDPKFRIVVTPARTKREGRFLEILGYYIPDKNPTFKINLERYNFWSEKGAKPSEAVLKLISQGQKSKNDRSQS